MKALGFLARRVVTGRCPDCGSPELLGMCRSNFAVLAAAAVVGGAFVFWLLSLAT